jgi:antitoxin CcdA
MRISLRIGGLTMTDLYDPDARKKPANLSINSDLLNKVRELDINLSATLERALAESLRQRRCNDWLADNRKAIDAYNEDVESHGVFSDGQRTF